MATLRDIQLRMGSIKNTMHITKAMKMVSASKMRRADEAITNSRPYAEKLRAIISNLSNGVDQSAHPLLKKREGGKAVVILISTNRGLCAGLNANLCKKLNSFISDQSNGFDEIELVIFGKKGYEFFNSRGGSIGDSYKELSDSENVDALQHKVRDLIQQYMGGKINHLFLAYNRFNNVVSQTPIIKQVLPIEPPVKENSDEDADIQFIFEPSGVEILNAILPQYVENQAFTALLDNNASEHAARMTAMDSATNNAHDMLGKLQIQYNRARQAAITSELIEIISGAEAV